jgi:hypothetical protein
MSAEQLRKVSDVEETSKQEFEMTLLQDKVAPLVEVNKTLTRIARALEWFKEQEEDRVKSRSAL